MDKIRKRKHRSQGRSGFRVSLLFEVALFFILSIFITYIASRYVFIRVADRSVQAEKEALGEGITNDLEYCIEEYDCYRWVMHYWIKHMSELDLEYDTSEKTVEKMKTLREKYPDIELKTIKSIDIEIMPSEDQKLIAEIIFNELLMRMNDMKRAYDVKFLYFFFTDDDLKTNTYLISASDTNLIRGTEMGNAFVMGTTIQNDADRIAGYEKVLRGETHLVVEQDYIDSYSKFTVVDGKNIIIGTTFEIAKLKTEVESRLVTYTLLFLSLQFALSIMCILMINQFALRPLKHITNNVVDYTDTKDSEQVLAKLNKRRSYNELGVLSDCLGEMITEIDNHVEEIRSITAENERISAELDVATQIQADMLPSIFPPFPDIPEIDVYATMNPAKEVGGDFYDFFMVDADHVALVVADVSGKGVPAALFMVISKTLIKNRAQAGGTPAEILNDVNNQLCEGNEAELFVTVWLAIINIRTGEGIAANAGHEHPALRHAGGDFELVVYKHSPVVGTLEGIKYRDHTFKLKHGDRIFSYSDGVPEATNSENELYGTDRMLTALNSNPYVDLADVLKTLSRDMDEFVGDATQFDDITMLIFEYK